MFNNLLKFSVVTVALIFIGCGSSSNNKVSNDLPPVSKDTRSLAKSLSFQGEVTDQLTKNKQISGTKFSKDLKQSREEYIESCTNGGSITIKNSFDTSVFENLDQNPDNFDFNDLNLSMTMSFDNCMEDNMIVNGSMQTDSKLEGESFITTMRYLTDFIVEDDIESFKILKDSYIIDEMVSQTKSISTETITVINDDEKYEVKDLKMATIMDENSFGFYPISGEEIINGESFKVDESYDASKTPMMMDDEGSLEKGGKSKYIDSKNNHITVEATAKDEITISVDTDNDGKADEQEVIKF